MRRVLVRQCKVLGHGRLNLHLHLIVHIALGFASAAVNNHDVDEDKGNDDSNN